MKKLMFSLCALCIVGAAGAQVSKAPLSEKAQRLQQESVLSPFQIKGFGVQTSESAPIRKAGANLDSIATQCLYNQSQSIYYGGLNWMSGPDQDLKRDGFCGEDRIEWVYGTGGFISWAGSGEIGYRFATGEDTYYGMAGYYPNFGIPYAASADLWRAPSTSRRHTAENGEIYYDSMPFYFKLYNSTKVGAQQVVASISQYGPDDYVDVVYPTDPEKYTAVSETIMIPTDCDIDDEGKGWPLLVTNAKAEFLNVDETQPLGNDFCLSLMFPIDWDEEGDSVTAATWNAAPAMGQLANDSYTVSEEPHSVYFVFDCQRATDPFNRPEDGKRWESWVLDPQTQPNERYAVIPMDSWYWKDGTNTTAEPLLKLYYTEWSALQSANKADRYVQVSPVPAVDYVNFSSYADMSRIEIYSLGGQLVKAVNVSGDSYTLDITGLNSGMYVARIYSEKGISSKKLIVR